MENILIIRQRLKQVFAKGDIYVLPVLKFLTTLMVIIALNKTVGYQDFLTKWVVVLVVSLICSLLPWPVISFVTAGFLIGHLAALSWEVTVLACVFLFLAAILQYLFLPGFSIVIVLIPVAFQLNIPYVIPLVLGLVGGATSFIPAGLGVFAYYFLVIVQRNAGFLADTSLQQPDILQRFTRILMALKDNSLMLLTMGAFCATVAIVYGIRKLSADYAPYIALAVGVIVNILIFLLGGIALNVSVPYLNVFLGSLVSVLLAMLIQFWIMAVDYSRTEYLQYEDDEYIYFVKAVPKITVTEPEIKVQEINPRVEEDSDADIEEALEILDAWGDEKN